MNEYLLFDPLFRLPFVTGLTYALLLPLLGMYLRLRGEWLAALALAQAASAGALLATIGGAPAAAGGGFAALAAAGIKALARRAAENAYMLMLLTGWAVSVLCVTNAPIAENMGHALFDGQLYFTDAEHLWLALGALLLVGAALYKLSGPLLLAHFFPELLRARQQNEVRQRLAFDCLAALTLALATTSIGVMAAFALIALPTFVAFRRAQSWRRGLLWAIGCGVICFVAAFILALALDQPFGPLCALILAAAAVLWSGRQTPVSLLAIFRSRKARHSSN